MANKAPSAQKQSATCQPDPEDFRFRVSKNIFRAAFRKVFMTIKGNSKSSVRLPFMGFSMLSGVIVSM